MLPADVDFWAPKFITYLNETRRYETLESVFEAGGSVQRLLSDFLFDGDGARYREHFKFDAELECGHEAPNITVS